MPTGYTSKLYEGEQSFADFVTGAAHAFGAMIQFRDCGIDELDKRIEQMQNEESYEARRLAELEAELARLTDLSTDDVEREFQEECRIVTEANNKSIGDARERHDRYSEMIAEVARWTPPTKDHEGLKDFMIKQLTESMRFDCHGYTSSIPADPFFWQQERINRAHKDIEYYEGQLAEAEKRRAERIKWTRDLIDSIKGV